MDVPALPLQLLLRKHPAWREHPVAVVSDDRPQGELFWVNDNARRLRVLPGMTFAAARSLASDLRAAVVTQEHVDETVGELFTALCNFSPRVEPSPNTAGVFWLDSDGLTMLYGSLEQWATTVHRDLQARGFQAAVVVGFHRFRSYALARIRRGPWVVPHKRQETMAAARVPLDRLDIPPQLRDGLAVLDVSTLGDFLKLPRAELRTRFGPEAAHLHEQASDTKWVPLQPRALIDPISTSLQFEPPDNNHSRLLFALKGALDRLTVTLAGRGQALSILHLRLELDHAGDHHEVLEPAAPTLDVLQMIDLVRLRLEGLSLPAGIEALHVEIEGTRADQAQLALFETRRRRDLEAANRALARLRASFGANAVTYVKLRAAHLPEAGFSWAQLSQLRFPTPSPAQDRPPPLVRRVFPKPRALPPRPRHEPEAWLGHYGAIQSMLGPYVVSGGWWMRTVERDYYFAQTQRGHLLWLYYDRPRRRWYLHGLVD